MTNLMSASTRRFAVVAGLRASDGSLTWVQFDAPLDIDAVNEQSPFIALVESDEDGSIIEELATDLVTARPLFRGGPPYIASKAPGPDFFRSLAEELMKQPPGWRMHVHGRSDGTLEVGSVQRKVERTRERLSLYPPFSVRETQHDICTFDPDDPDVTARAAEYTALVRGWVDERNEALAHRSAAATDALVDAELAAERQARRSADSRELAGILRGALANWSPPAR